MTASDPGRTAYETLAQRLRAWGENDADPTYFQGDALSCLLLDCGAAGEAIGQLQIERDSAEKVMQMAATSGGFHAKHAENATKRAEAAEAEAARWGSDYADAMNARIEDAITMERIGSVLAVFARMNAMDPPEGVRLNDWLPAITGARAALKEAGLQRLMDPASGTPESEVRRRRL